MSLHDSLKKYYSRSSSKITFVNGMSLNELATEMWEDLGYQSVDSSVLSKIINGKRQFTKEQAKSFCKILHISEEEKDIILSSIPIKQTNTRNFLHTSFITPEYLELVSCQIELVPFLRSEGSIKYANQLMTNQELVLNKHLSLVKSGSAERIILRSISKIFLEKSRNVSDVADHGQGYPKMLPIGNTLKALAEKINDAEAFSRYYQSKGDALYNIKKYTQAAEFFKLAFETTEHPYWKLEGMRAHMLCLAKIGTQKYFKEMVKRIDSFIQDGKFADQFFLITVYEAMGRGFAYFSQEKAFEMLDTAKRITKSEEEKGRLAILPKIQIIRSHLTTLSLLPNSENDSFIEKTGKEGVELSSFHSYIRQENEIKSLLNTMLNR